MKPLYGLVLAGGLSRRMGFPKEWLHYRDKIEMLRVFDLLNELTSEVFFSIRSEQASWKAFLDQPVIVDRIPDSGPLGAVHSAFCHKPSVSWLIVPVDMPFLEPEDLIPLIEARMDHTDIIAYKDKNGGLEPLPAIYEASLGEHIRVLISKRRLALRNLGDGHNITLLEAENPWCLTNINTSGQRDKALKDIGNHNKHYQSDIKNHFQ